MVPVMASGTPVVASRVGGMASTVVHGETGLLAPVGDATAFAQAIGQLLSAPRLWQACRRGGQQRAQVFAWPQIAERTLQLYRRLLRQTSEEVTPPLSVPGNARSRPRRSHAAMPCPL